MHANQNQRGAAKVGVQASACFGAANRLKPGLQRRQAGFTLIEMMVATTLVALMLLMFAEVFGTAVATMRKQQSLAHNDQKARSIESVLRSDLFKATSRQPRVKGVAGLVPLSATSPVDADRQRGYLHIAENDIENPVDDILQFTIDTRITTRDPTVSVLRGRAQQLTPPDGSASTLSRNQPDYDDGVFGNNVGESHTAEVSYFVRNGNLYRRMLLLREPPVPSSFVGNIPNATPPPAQFSSQPGVGLTGANFNSGSGVLYDRMFMRSDGTNLYAGDYAVARAFWSDFDYSAFNLWQDLDGGGTMDTFPNDRYVLMFNGEESLQNAPGATPFPIARPEYRFGHRPPAPATLSPLVDFRVFAGQPMDYLLDVPINGSAVSTYNPVGFIGRFTHEETSSVNAATSFSYPGAVPQDGATGATHPMLQSYTANWDGLNQNGLVDGYENGLRAAEDLILSNVEAFDIEVWDDGFIETDIDGDGNLDTQEDLNGNTTLDSYPAQWVNLGHNGYHPVAGGLTNMGWFHCHRNQNRNYGGRMVSLGADGQPGVSGVDDDGINGVDDAGELGWPGSDDVVNRCFDTWHPEANVGLFTANAYGSMEPPFGGYRLPTPAAGTVGWVGSRWAPNWAMYKGHYIFPGVTEDQNFNRVLDPNFLGNPDTDDGDGVLLPAEDTNGNNAFDPPEDVNNDGYLAMNEDLNHDGVFNYPEDANVNGTFDPAENLNNSVDGAGNPIFDRYVREDRSYYYRVVGYRGLDLNGDGNLTTPPYEPIQSGAQEPEWPREPGATVVDGNVIWQCFDNRVSLPMIRITVRYRDVGTGLPRQVSIVHSFVE